MGIAKGRRSLWFWGNQLGWLMWQSLVFGEVVGRIITLLPKAESLGFLLLPRRVEWGGDEVDQIM